MSWFAWIPILSNGIITSGEWEFSEVANDKITKEFLASDNSIALALDEAVFVFHTERCPDDNDKSRDFLFSCYFTTNKVIKAMIISEHKGNGIYDANALVMLRLHKRTGMIEFDCDCLCGYTDPFNTIPVQAYKFIREMFHKHLWTKSDFGMFPVKEDTIRDAVVYIWNAYYGERVMVKANQDLKRDIENTEWNYMREGLWNDIIYKSARMTGEMIYAKSFAQQCKGVLNEKESDKFVEASERAIEQFNNYNKFVENRYKQHCEQKGKERSYLAITAAGFFFTVQFVFNEYFSKRQDISNDAKVYWKIGFVLGIPLAAYIVFAAILWFRGNLLSFCNDMVQWIRVNVFRKRG